VVFPNKRSEKLYSKFFGFKEVINQRLSLYLVYKKSEYRKSLIGLKFSPGENIRPDSSSSFKRRITNLDNRFVNVPCRKYIFCPISESLEKSTTTLIFRKLYRFINVQADLVRIPTIEFDNELKKSRLPHFFIAPSNFATSENLIGSPGVLEFRIPNQLLPHRLIGLSNLDKSYFTNGIQLSDIDVF
jgi:hypothetical protein